MENRTGLEMAKSVIAGIYVYGALAIGLLFLAGLATNRLLPAFFAILTAGISYMSQLMTLQQIQRPESRTIFAMVWSLMLIALASWCIGFAFLIQPYLRG